MAFGTSQAACGGPATVSVEQNSDMKSVIYQLQSTFVHKVMAQNFLRH
jgi:hypothetical protein